jgi:hypothetical protein
VASVTTDTGPLFSDVTIETSGGSEPIVCHGHRRSDAVRMKELIERYQAEQREVRVSRRRPPPRVLSASVPSARRPSRPRRGSAATADGSRPPREGERDHGPVLAGTGTEPGRGRDGGEAPE